MNTTERTNSTLSKVSLRVRALHPKFDRKHYVTAWKWTTQKPDWFQSSMLTWGMSKEEFFVKITDPLQVDFGVFQYSTLIAVITTNEVAPGVIEAHIDCAKHIDFKLIVQACKITTQHVFSVGVQFVNVWVQAFNRPILKLYAELGFLPTNISIFRGTCKEKPVEWRQFALTPDQVQ